MPVFSGANCLVPLFLDSNLDPPVSSLVPILAHVNGHLPSIAATITTLIFNVSVESTGGGVAKPYKPREEVCSR